MPLRQHEMVYVFSDDENHEYNDLDNSRNIGLREYFKSVMTYTNKPKNEMIKTVGQGLDHCLRINSTQFNLPTAKTYNKLIEVYGINQMEGFRTIEDLQTEWTAPPEKPETTYNPQKTAGKPWFVKAHDIQYTDTYGQNKIIANENKTGDRHPTSIINIPDEPREHEMVYIFSDTNSDDLDNSRNIGLREYFKSVMTYTNKPKNEMIKTIGQGLDHCLRINSTQFNLPTAKTYNKLIEVYGINQMEGFRTIEDLQTEWGNPTYNPQKTTGKPYKTNGVDMTNSYYRGGTTEYKGDPIHNKGDRHPTTIVKFNNPVKSIHRTQKPTDLCEWLVKSYSNENDIVLDFCMGSGSTGIACLNTGRQFIGIEKDPTIFKLAKNRLLKHEIEEMKFIK
tara:strand:- start:30 stop:1205 length:1176 start_codon:yes stop_codon:yes gene_type:complete